MESYIFQPNTASLWNWLIIAIFVLLFCLYIMIKTGKRNQKVSGQKSSALIFLLTGMFFLIGLTITCFMGFNLVKTQTVKVDKDYVTIGAVQKPITSIRKTYIHSEGSGIPFNGLGANKGSDKSLIIEWSNGESIILSEDFYPLEEIVTAIQTIKKKE